MFSIRMAGVPFDRLDSLSTPQTAASARAVVDSEIALRDVDAKGDLAGGKARHARLLSHLDQCLDAELSAARAALWIACREILPRYLVFGAGGIRELQQRLLRRTPLQAETLPPRNAKAGDRERHLLLYLQRVCAKNDTLSEFGPTSWGMIESAPLRFGRQPGIARRIVYLERWTAHVVAAALNADPDVRAEIAPRANPNGQRIAEGFYLPVTGVTHPLSALQRELLEKCDGKRPAHALRVDYAILDQLASIEVIRWQVEVPALHAQPMREIVKDIEHWRDTPARARWLRHLGPLADLARQFAVTEAVDDRVRMMDEARATLNALGAQQPPSQRFLYAATNPIGEDCSRDQNLGLPLEMADVFARDAAPWIDLWRDTYAFVASRVAESLRHLLSTVPGADSKAVPLPAFLQHCADQKLPLTSHGMVAPAVLAFQEIKAAFSRIVGSRIEAPEWELTPEDCSFVRRTFDYPAFDEYTYPSADLQISARSFQAAAKGDYEWIVSEFHPPVAMLHQCFFWNCPNPALLAQSMASTVFDRPNFHFGFFAADFTSHTTVRLFDGLPELTWFVAPQRGDPGWKAVVPADAEVYVEKNSGDVCLRERTSGRHLGSFARAWIIPLGFHPFHFGRAPHMPRLRCGSVIVQRRSWTVTLEEFPSGNFTGISRELVLALEKLRAARDLPRYIYIRPTERALRRSGAEGRDKDTKPVFIDLESYLFLEIFHRWLAKAGELEITEMLPDPEHLCWQEADGRRTFELRTLIVPRSS